MIQPAQAPVETRVHNEEPRWQKILAGAVTTPGKLCERLALPESLIAGMEPGHRHFPIRVPEPYLSRIEPGNPRDPLLRQVMPEPAESEPAPGYVTDPLSEFADASASADGGLIHKYQSRALLVVTGACAINCRYCFRRHFPYGDHQLGGSGWEHPLAQLAADERINEVIFSGGDPLATNDRVLGRLAGEVERIPHIKRLRLHTRLPVVIPQRVDSKLLAWLGNTRLQTILVVHVNHPAEIDGDVKEAMEQLKNSGVLLLNQTVLLRGINDDAYTLERLSEALFDAGVLPYYLHAFDPVAGAAHYDPGDERARELARELLTRLPGFLVPRLVREIPGEGSKRPLDL
jgi:EF-P beta-lysylation protein EpmB